jgi:glycosyltransferase involved in cell wall biosynthesis
MIVFDVQALQSAAHGQRGIGRYTSELARALHTGFPELVSAFAWNDRLPRTPELDRLEVGAQLVPFSALAGERVDLLHVNSPFEMLDLAEIAVPVDAHRLVVTCYDVIPYRFAEAYLVDQRAAARYRARLGMLASADAVVTDSQSAADDLAELVGIDRRRLHVIGGGVGREFVPPTDDVAARIAALRAEVPDLSEGYVLVPTGMDWRKNAAGAIEAYAQLPDELRARHQLVLACEVQPGYEAWLRLLADEAGVADRLVITGYVTDATLVRLYQTAEVVFFPSFYEGFGLPVLEALRCGARVITSAASSLPELIGDKRALFDPSDPADMARLLESALRDPAVGARAGSDAEARFTWPATARKLVAVYRSLSRRRDRSGGGELRPLRHQ